MFYTILKAFGFAIYSEKDFFISKKDDTHFKVTAKSGLSANVEITDDTMFVDLFDQSKENVGYYCTPLADTLLSVENFVIKNIQDSLLFKLSTNDLVDYLRTYNTLFKDVRNIYFMMHFLDDDAYDDNSKKINNGYLYEHTEHNKICYSHVQFTKKKVIKNIVRYSFYMTPLQSFDKHKASHSYLMGDTFFDVCNMDQFIRSTTDASLAHYTFNDVDIAYGINNQLNDHHQNYKANIDLNKVAVLKRKHKDYCLMTKNKRQITLRYLTDFNIRYAALEKDPSYSSERAEFKGDEVPVYRYKDKKMITYTYCNGQIKSTSVKFSADDAAHHEISISNRVMNNLDSLRLKYPSDQLLNKLRDFGLSCEVPLNPDDLCVLAMIDI
jgi:hypothetical protein